MQRGSLLVPRETAIGCLEGRVQPEAANRILRPEAIRRFPDIRRRMPPAKRGGICGLPANPPDFRRKWRIDLRRGISRYPPIPAIRKIDLRKGKKTGALVGPCVQFGHAVVDRAEGTQYRKTRNALFSSYAGLHNRGVI